jgi:hypothetical protein
MCVLVLWVDGADDCVAGFETDAHPYKQNLLKYPGHRSTSILEVPEVQQTLSTMKNPSGERST